MAGFVSGFAETRRAHDGTGRSELTKDLVYIANDGTAYVVRKGFKSDLASIPRFLWPIFPPLGNYKSAAILHDQNCETDDLSRKAGDYLLLEGMSHSGVKFISRWCIFLGVRAYAIVMRKK